MASSSKSAGHLLADRMKHLLSSGEDADAFFLVGEKKELLSAHRIILKQSSDVFAAMFRYDSKNGKAGNASANNPVEIPDVEPAAFKVMLSFIYADDLSGLDEDNTMAVLYAAQKYNIIALIDQCLQIPISRLRNVFLAYTQAQLLDFEEFAHQCFRFICQNAHSLFDSDDFLQIDQNFLCKIFENDNLMISSEFELWEAALRWSHWHCVQNGIESSHENRRSVLGPALFKIRFSLIALDTFARQIVPCGILTADEVLGVYQFHCHLNFHGVPGQYPLKFPFCGRISDWNISKGDRATLALEIGNLSHFVREEVGTCLLSVPVDIMGLPWQICARINAMGGTNEKWLGFCIWHNAPELVANWRRICSATFRIIPQKNGTDNCTGKYNNIFFNSNSWPVGFFHYICCTELMDPSRGLYDQNEDKLTLAVDLFVEEEPAKEYIFDPFNSNGTIAMEIGKLSEFAQEIYGSGRASETIRIKGLPWQIASKICPIPQSSEKWLTFALLCTAPKEDEKRYCNCSATLRIASRKNETFDFFTKSAEECFLTDQYVLWRFFKCISFAQLMNPDNGLYDKNEDTIKLVVNFIVSE